MQSLAETDTIFTASEPFRKVLDEAGRAAATDLGILVTGETGTGKEVLARWIHRASPRRARPFVTIDCSALPGSTIESELFGHSRGAFSGAERDRAGRFEAAAGGTVFLDGVDDLDPAAQAHLLRVIEEREVLRLGETRPRRVDFRLLASAGPELRRLAAEGGFRRDLFYRLNVVELALPPLRERPEDIPFLARAFLLACARRFGKPLREISPAAMAVLRSYRWPGNVRELEIALESAAAAARGEIVGESDLPVHVRIGSREAGGEAVGAPIAAEAPPAVDPGGPGGSARCFSERVEDFQRSLLLETLARTSWSHREAAVELGLERHQLKYLCAKLGIRRSAV